MSKKIGKTKKSEVKMKDSGYRLAIMAPGLDSKELDKLRTQIDLAMLDPTYTIITNYHFDIAVVPVVDPQ